MARLLSFDGDEMREVIEGEYQQEAWPDFEEENCIAIMLEETLEEMFQVVYPGEQTMGCKFVCRWCVGEDAP